MWHDLMDRNLMGSVNDAGDVAEGTLLHKLRHKDAVYGCAWSPHHPYILATGTRCIRLRFQFIHLNWPG